MPILRNLKRFNVIWELSPVWELSPLCEAWSRLNSSRSLHLSTRSTIWIDWWGWPYQGSLLRRFFPRTRTLRHRRDFIAFWFIAKLCRDYLSSPRPQNLCDLFIWDLWRSLLASTFSGGTLNISPKKMDSLSLNKHHYFSFFSKCFRFFSSRLKISRAFKLSIAQTQWIVREPRRGTAALSKHWRTPLNWRNHLIAVLLLTLPGFTGTIRTLVLPILPFHIL